MVRPGHLTQPALRPYVVLAWSLLGLTRENPKESSSPRPWSNGISRPSRGPCALLAITQASRYLRTISAPLHGRAVAKLDRREVAALLSAVEGRSGGITRNRLRATLSAFFAWCIAEGVAETNPVTGTGRAVETTRDRVLSPAELAAVWHGPGNGRFADIVRLLILTGQRRDEIGSLRWSEITDDSIVSPPERTKNRRQHIIPLSPLAQSILERQPRPWEFVFAAGGFTNWHKTKLALDAQISIPRMDPARHPPHRRHRPRRTRRAPAYHRSDLVLMSAATALGSRASTTGPDMKARCATL